MNEPTTKEIVLDWCVGILCMAALAGILALAVWQASGQPDVIFSYSTKQCVKVEFADGSLGDCSRLPEKYNHIWGR